MRTEQRPLDWHKEVIISDLGECSFSGINGVETRAQGVKSYVGGVEAKTVRVSSMLQNVGSEL